jgi:hypothetical protein
MRGGLRTRLVLDSARLTVIAGLQALGWFDGTIHDTTPGLRRHRPLKYVPRPKKWDDPIEPNAFAVSLDDITDMPLGLGGEVEDSHAMYVDIFAESDPLGWDLAMDIRDVLLGKRPEVGRYAPLIDVFDLRQATPAPFTQVEVDTVLVDRAEGEAAQWRAHWFMVRFDLLDPYDDESDALHPTVDWTQGYANAWAYIQTIELAAP